MPRNIIILSKVIGTVSLGVLTGSIAAGTFVSLPILKDGLISVETSNQQQKSLLVALHHRIQMLVTPLSITSFATLLSAYLFASARARHPYLLYSALSVPVLGAINYFYGDLEWLDSREQQPVAVRGAAKKEPKKVAEPEELSGLDNSVYGRVDRVDSESDNDSSSQDNNSDSFQPVSSQTVKELHCQLNWLGWVGTGVSGIAFLIATVGIYGDFS